MGHQFVVHIEDRPGALSRLTHELAVHGIDIHHVAGIGSGAIGYVVLVVEQDDDARAALTAAGYAFEEGLPLMVVIDDRPGALAELSDRLGAAGVNIHSLLVQDRGTGLVDVSLTVDDIDTARAALGQ
jgi:hypothetical protein